MKKILILITLYLFCISQVQAECLIKNSEAPVLNEYFQNTNKILSTLTRELKTQTTTKSDNAVINEFSNEIKRVSDATVWAYNRAFDFDYFLSDFEFQVELPKLNEHPKEIIRDYELIKNYHEKLRDYLSAVIISGKKGVVIKDFCSKTGVASCNIEKGQNAEQIMQIIISNHTRLKYLYEQIVSGKTTIDSYIYFTPENFNLEMQTYYGAQSISSCNYENEFATSIRKRTNKIASLEQNNKNAIQKWKDAWKLLHSDTNSSSYQNIEKDLLKKELQRQGVSGDNQTIMLQNLEKFNVAGFTANNNLFTNTFRSFTTKVEDQVHKFQKRKLAGYLEGQDSVGITQTLDTIDKADEKKIWIEELTKLHGSLELYAAQTATVSGTLTDQILSIHTDLSESINILSQSCKKAVKLCNNQAKNKGNCGNCD